MKYTKLFIGFWFVAVVAIIVTSLLPQFSPTDKYNFDKILHLMGYLLLSLISTISFKSNRSIFWAVIILILVAILTEIGQGYVPHRMASIGDVIANFIGIIAGYLLGRLFRKKFSDFFF